MSLTTESSLHRDRGASRQVLSRICRIMCPCSSRLRRISPSIDPLPDVKDFMILGKHRRRVICVLHYEPHLNSLLLTKESLALKLKKVVQDDCDSDSSSDEYWFSKWTVPLRTVKKLQNQNESAGVKKPLTPFIISTFATNQSDRIIEQAALEAAGKIKDVAQPNIPSEPLSVHSLPTGIVNPGFECSHSDPESSVLESKSTFAVPKQSPMLYFIHGAGESSDSWKNVLEYFACLNYEVVAVDLLGHGFSSTPNQRKYYTFKKLLADVVKIFDEHVYSGRKAVLIGHGYG